MATKISNCGHDEHGTYHGGSAGDQSGTEYYVRDWYQFATAVYRHPTTKIANMIATVAKAAAENDCIGYDQDDRTTFYTQLKAAEWYPEKITKKCEADCSSSTAACVIAAGHRCNDEKCQKVAYTMTTYNEDSQLKSAGFSKLTASKYLTSGDYLKKGDILWKDGHTAVVVSNGSKASSSSSSSSSSGSSSGSSSSKLTVDGQIGKNTVKRLQKVMGTTQDGTIDGQPSACKKYWTSVLSSVCKWSGGSSDVVKALQKYVTKQGYSTTADGQLGTKTAKAVQKFLIAKKYSCGSTGADGYFGTNSAKALQKWLNAQ